MTSLQGTDTAYAAIDGNYLALSPECSDTIFGTNINYCNLVRAGTNPYGFMKGKFVDGNEEDPTVLNEYEKFKVNFQSNLARTLPLKKEAPKTVYDLLHLIPNVSETLKLVDETDFAPYLINAPKGITFIAPTNDFLKKARSSWFKTKSKGIIKSILMAHLLDYILAPRSIASRLLRVFTHNPAFWFTADGTQRYSKEITFYQEPTSLLNNEYSLRYDRFNIVGTYMTDNGILYVIDGMFLPENINYSTF
jgi:hypothetical protein